MRKLVPLLLALSLILAPVTSMIATAMGFSGEHVHYDHTWHGTAEWMQAKAASHKHHHDSHHDDGHGDRAVHNYAAHDYAVHDEGGDSDSAPLKHSHADQVHTAAFLVAVSQHLLQPRPLMAADTVPVSRLVQQHPYPPFRPPPQSV